MKTVLTTISVAAFAALLASPGLAAAKLTDAKGMTLYVFDKDTKDTSTCYDACAKLWPPYLVKDATTMGDGWTAAKRKDGSMQWAYDGKPLYYYNADTKAGDAKGDGFKGVWHTATQ